MLEDRPSHKGYSELIYKEINSQQEFLEALRDLCLVYGYQVLGEIQPFNFKPNDFLEYRARPDGTLEFTWSNNRAK